MRRPLHRKYERIEMCPDDGIQQLAPIAEEFMRAIFGAEPGSYLITDMSDLTDFTVDDLSTEQLICKVMDTYHLGLVPSNLLLLFRELQLRTKH